MNSLLDFIDDYLTYIQEDGRMTFTPENWIPTSQWDISEIAN